MELVAIIQNLIVDFFDQILGFDHEKIVFSYDK